MESRLAHESVKSIWRITLAKVMLCMVTAGQLLTHTNTFEIHSLQSVVMCDTGTCRILPPATPPFKSSTSDPGLFTSKDRMTIICGGDVKSLQVRVKSVGATALQSLKVMVPCMPWHVIIVQADKTGCGWTLLHSSQSTKFCQEFCSTCYVLHALQQQGNWRPRMPAAVI